MYSAPIKLYVTVVHNQLLGGGIFDNEVKDLLIFKIFPRSGYNTNL